MPKFKVQFKEIIFKEVEVEADNPEDAEDIVVCGDFDDNEVYEVDSGDIAVVEITEIG